MYQGQYPVWSCKQIIFLVNSFKINVSYKNTNYNKILKFNFGFKILIYCK